MLQLKLERWKKTDLGEEKAGVSKQVCTHNSRFCTECVSANNEGIKTPSVLVTVSSSIKVTCYTLLPLHCLGMQKWKACAGAMALQSLSFVLSCELSFHYVLIIAPSVQLVKKKIIFTKKMLHCLLLQLWVSRPSEAESCS